MSPGAGQGLSRILAIAEDLSRADPGNAGWRRDLSALRDGLLNPQLKPLSSQHMAPGWPVSPDSSSQAFPLMSRERGARRGRVFFGEDDDALYRDLLASQCRKHGRGGLLPIA